MSIINFIIEKLDLLDRAIVDGKSPATLKGYIVDMRDHIAAAKERDLTTEIEILRAEFSDLSAKHNALKAQLAASSEAKERLHDDAAKILKFYFNNTESAAIGWVAFQLGIHPSEAEAHASDLSDMDFIIFCGAGDSALYAIAPAGTKYVMKHLR